MTRIRYAAITEPIIKKGMTAADIREDTAAASMDATDDSQGISAYQAWF